MTDADNVRQAPARLLGDAATLAKLIRAPSIGRSGMSGSTNRDPQLSLDLPSYFMISSRVDTYLHLQNHLPGASVAWN